MGGIEFIETTSKRQGGLLGKIVSPLDEKLKSVEWGTYKLEKLFKIEGTKSLDRNAIEFVENGVNFVGRTNENNGIQGKIIKQNFAPNAPYTITATVIGNYKYVKYQTETYYCSQNINKLTPKAIFKVWNYSVAYFCVANIQKFVSQYDGQQGGYKLDDIKNFEIFLPIKNNKIDFVFMESFLAELEAQHLAELEAQHLAELEAYLSVTGLDDYTLTEEEEKIIGEYDNFDWREYKIDDLFERVKTKKLHFKAVDLPKEPNGKYTLPCLTSSFNNQGLNYYVPRDGSTILKNVISIPSNSDVYRAYFQSNEFTVLSDAYAIKCKLSDVEFSSNHYLFAVMSINKVTDLPIYSYKNKLGGWNVVKDKTILLPTKNNKLDYNSMEVLISAIKKLVIKDVVLYANNKTEATKIAVKK